jgi:alpha-mannosidase
MTQAHPEEAPDWEPLLLKAGQLVAEALKKGSADVAALVQEAEGILEPLSPAAKEYCIYCCGHAHIDMNWMWSWPETVAVTYDTFSTMDALMDEFPDFHFSQSQASVYIAMQQYAPELFERIKQRVAEGRWEITASQWVEGDKNLASGEILARHLLYTRRYLKEAMGIPYDAIKIDWEPDTFGHCWTLPGLLARGGVSRYYHHRASGPRLRSMSSGETCQLFWWEGKDGRRILAYDDSPNGYNGEIAPRMAHLIFAMERHTGLKDILWVYGVGDHGGGPTRRHLRAAQAMQGWPVWPQVKLTTTDDYYSTVERKIEEQGIDLPVHRDEINFVFEGCYTSESRIKFANRKGECDLVDTEIAALVGSRACGLEYPASILEECWRRSMFIQFHDILPGSGVKETVEHAMGLFQENLANTGTIRTRALRAMAAKVDTSSLAPACAEEGADTGLGAGVGNGAWWGGVSTLGAGECSADPFVVFNPAPSARNELVHLKVWNRELPDGKVVVRDGQGNAVPGQITERGNYWGHSFAVVTFAARALPPVGYRAYVVDVGSPTAGEPGVYVNETGRPVYGLGYVNAQLVNPVVMCNEHVELVVSGEAGGIISLIDKSTGEEFTIGGVLGSLEREQEAPHGMTAWQLGTIVNVVEPLADSVLRVLHGGPHMATVELTSKHNDSDYRLTITLASGSPRIDFQLDVNWLERGDPQTGVPALRASFPLSIEDGKANFEIPCGSIERPTDAGESPALNWVDLTGKALGGELPIGATLLNDCKYGHSVSDDTIRLTLLRSSYDPDPLPELGRHSIRYALVPHSGDLDLGDATHAGHAFNHPIVPVGTTVHEGDLPVEGSALEILAPNVMLSGLKKAEDDDALIIRLYEFEGRQTAARVRLSRVLAEPDSAAVETDLLEQPLDKSTAAMDGDVLTVTIPAFGIATVRVG